MTNMQPVIRQLVCNNGLTSKTTTTAKTTTTNLYASTAVKFGMTGGWSDWTNTIICVGMLQHVLCVLQHVLRVLQHVLCVCFE